MRGGRSVEHDVCCRDADAPVGLDRIAPISMLHCFVSTENIMADNVDSTSEQGQRQLSSMTEEERSRYDAALKSRQEEAQRESVGSVKRRYGLSSRGMPDPMVPQPVEGEPTATMTEPPTTARMSTELAERMKQFHSASPGPMKDYFASEIQKLQERTETMFPSVNSGNVQVSALGQQVVDSLGSPGRVMKRGSTKMLEK